MRTVLTLDRWNCFCAFPPFPLIRSDTVCDSLVVLRFVCYYGLMLVPLRQTWVATFWSISATESMYQSQHLGQIQYLVIW